MSEIGEGISKPWDRETCRRRYVEGTQIGLRGIEKLSGVTFGKLSEWSRGSRKEKRDPNFQPWPEQRAQYQDEIKAKTRQKSTELISDRYAEQNSQVLTRHIELSAVQRDLAGAFMTAMKIKVNMIMSPNNVSKASADRAEELIKLFERVAGRVPMQVVANILGQAVGMDRQSLHLDLADPETLERMAKKHGFELVDSQALDADAE